MLICSIVLLYNSGQLLIDINSAIKTLVHFNHLTVAPLYEIIKPNFDEFAEFDLPMEPLEAPELPKGPKKPQPRLPAKNPKKRLPKKPDISMLRDMQLV